MLFKNKYPVFLFLLIAVITNSCNEKKANRNIDRSFYYWRSVFKLNPAEQEYLKQLNISTLYIKFFDVDWDEAGLQALPKAKIVFTDTMSKELAIIPVIFITNGCIQKIEAAQIPLLAGKIMQLINEIIVNNNISAIPEIQFDCDWSAATKDKYFLLLNECKKLKPPTSFSATIRLHQVKYISSTGVPPVDRGLLMCYNMGNLKNPASKNSIIETAELKKYISNLAAYPLPLDVGLPLFNWKVLFRENVYMGLIQELPDSLLNISFCNKKDNRFELLKDTLLQGYQLKKGDILRSEESNYDEIMSVAAAINSRLKNTRPRVALYHLDALILNKYSLNELENIYSSLR